MMAKDLLYGSVQVSQAALVEDLLLAYFFNRRLSLSSSTSHKSSYISQTKRNGSFGILRTDGSNRKLEKTRTRTPTRRTVTEQIPVSRRGRNTKMGDNGACQTKNVNDYDEEEGDKPTKALDEGDIALLKTYGVGPYTNAIKKAEEEISKSMDKVKELIGIQESDTGLSLPSQWDLVADKQMMQEEQPLQVASCTTIINSGQEDAKYVINVRQIAKFVVALGDKVAPTDVEEGMRVGVDRVKYSIQIPLPPRIDSTVSLMTVEDKPDVTYDDVGGAKEPLEQLREVVELPLLHPERFVTLGIDPPKGALLYGPPGTGKSYLAKAVATEADATFFAVSSADLVSKWQGESQKLVRNLFELAREAGNAIIFIDEVDSLCSSRSEGENESARQIKTEFLVQMDGVQASAAREGAGPGRVLVLGATNVPWELDAAIRRRFEKRVYIPLPEGPARARMFQIHIGDTPNTLTEEDFERLGEMSEGYSGSDISVLIREALYEPVRKCQQAKQWLLTPEGLYTPCEEYPSCDQCPPKLSSDPPGTQYPPCHNCSAVRMNLYDIASDKLKVPILGFGDFQKALEKARPSVAQEELGEFVEWTEEFGQEG
uniref:AAA+ ATPase domain-containing protein n=1 Tax=Heterosigma akashiwo TaxID=2829 RepID=A0A7S3Y2G3_HETAK